MHDHAGGDAAVAAGGVVGAALGLLLAAVAAWHARRFYQAAVRRDSLLLPAEAGHTLLAVGMAAMLAVPRLVAGSLFVWLYLAGALAFLSLVVGDPRCCGASFWSCYSVLTVESFAMAAMTAAARGWTDGFQPWFVVFFALTGVGAVSRLTIPRLVQRLGGGDPLVPAASRAVMSGTMLLMFL